MVSEQVKITPRGKVVTMEKGDQFDWLFQDETHTILFAIQTNPERKFFFKDKEVSQDEMMEILQSLDADKVNLSALAHRVFMANSDKGFHDEPKELGVFLMLMVSELAEALESDRKGNECRLDRFLEIEPTINADHAKGGDQIWKENFEEYIKDTVEDELADTIIRILDYCGSKGIDIHKHMELKMKYNSLRPHKHGKSY